VLEVGDVHLPRDAAGHDPDPQQAALLVRAGPGQRDVLRVRDREGGQERVAELPPRAAGAGRVEVAVRPVRDVHPQLACQPVGLVDEAAARAVVPVDLLEADHVRPGIRMTRAVRARSTCPSKPRPCWMLNVMTRSGVPIPADATGPVRRPGPAGRAARLGVRDGGGLPVQGRCPRPVAGAGGEVGLGGDGVRVVVQGTAGAGRGEQRQPGGAAVRVPVRHGPVQRDHRGRLDAGQPVVPVRDGRPVGRVGGGGGGVAGGDAGLQPVRAVVAAAGQRVATFGDRGVVPAAPVLPVEGEQVAVAVAAGVPPGVLEQHQRQQPGHLGLPRHEPVEQPGQPDRLVGERGLAVGVVALREQQVEHGEDAGQPLGERGAGRHPVRIRACAILVLARVSRRVMVDSLTRTPVRCRRSARRRRYAG
jgi:hypothetical protein